MINIAADTKSGVGASRGCISCCQPVCSATPNAVNAASFLYVAMIILNVHDLIQADLSTVPDFGLLASEREQIRGVNYTRTEDPSIAQMSAVRLVVLAGSLRSPPPQRLTFVWTKPLHWCSP